MPPNLSALTGLAAVARHRSFVRAAAELGLSKSALSHAVRGLEDQLGARLFNRTTRSVAPTEAGARLLARLRPALDDIADAMAEAAAGPGHAHGTVRLNIPRLAAALVLAPKLASFAVHNPAVHLEVTVEDGTVDIVAGGFDAGVRLGERLQADMIAVPVTPPLRMAAAAAPSYFALRPPPTHPLQLVDHACLRYRYPSSGAIYAWEFEQEGRAVEIDVSGPMTTGDQEFMVKSALGGAGIVYTVESYIAEELAAGRLVRVLDSWCAPFPGLFLYWSHRRHVPPALRALIDALKLLPDAAEGSVP